jgi:glycerol-3-phosphate acyltransferase PlsX
MRIVVDVMGGDHGAATIVGGVGLALQSHAAISEVYLVGKQDEIQAALNAGGWSDPRVRIVHCSEALTMEDKPVEALRRKKDCSILRAVDLLKEGRADALISTGNTGGLVAASTIRLRPLPGVDRPCIATVIPSRTHEFVLLDAGASVECRANQLVHFAVMGSIYAREILGHKNPRVGLLSNGTEPNKGTELTLEAYKLCQLVNLNFIGNVEGHDLFSDRMDVVVCDGFVGNIVLKTIESFAKGLFSWVKHEVTKNPVRTLGGMLVKPGLRAIARRMDPDNHGGAPLLGLNGTIIKAHGSARERAVMNAIGQSTQAVQNRINEIIVREIAAANDRIAAAKA